MSAVALAAAAPAPPVLLAHGAAAPLGLAVQAAAVAALVWWASRAGARRGRHAPSPLLLALGGGTVLAALAVLDAPAGSGLVAHMAQHLLLTSVAAPLLALGGIGSVLAAALPRRARPPLARTGLAVRRRPGAVAGIVVAAALAHAVALWAWHLPAAYDLAVRQDLAHLLEHASMLLTAVLLWAAALGSRRARPHVALLALLVTAVQGAALGALLTFAPRPLYTSYAEGPGALADQQLAGLLMWVPGGVLPLAAAALLTRWWLAQPPGAARVRVPAGLAGFAHGSADGGGH